MGENGVDRSQLRRSRDGPPRLPAEIRHALCTVADADSSIKSTGVDSAQTDFLDSRPVGAGEIQGERFGGWVGVVGGAEKT